MIKTADTTKNITSYENFSCVCPECKIRNIFNRISDLNDLNPIDSKIVKCQNSKCLKNFAICSDKVFEHYESIIFDCHELIKEKKYMSCVINLCQGCEAFFYHAVQVKLMWHPYKEKRFLVEQNDLNYLLRKLQNKVDNFTYLDMRAVFYDLFFFGKHINSISDTESYLTQLNPKKLKRDLSKVDLAGCVDLEKKSDFGDLQNLTINTLRNDVAHKFGYRPNELEVKDAFDKIKNLIARLKVHNNIKGVYRYLN